ncbi:MAG TPA: hypothetical protein VKW77_01465, partial [Acidimicrobiales bacterium]|nr:hypothetical protein [Acidimicrobiales bacterium]
LMGMTLPLLGRATAPTAREAGRAVAILYGANTLGAALGALLAGVALLPALGVRATTALAVGVSLAVALLALRMEEPAPIEVVPAAEEIDPSPRLALVALAVLGLGGAVTFALETACVHLLAVVAGNSAYAFSLMLFAFLLGLGIGAALARPLLARARSLPFALAVVETLLAIAVLGGAFVWERMPAVFVRAGALSLAGTFAGRELVRSLACLVALVPPAVAIGAAFPLAMAAFGQARPSRGAAPVVGMAAAVNTVGNVAGALLGGFLLLPRLGSLRTLQALALVSLALGLLPLIALRVRRPAPALVLAFAAVALLALGPRRFDLDRLASGANVYFRADPKAGHVIDAAESLDGGLTTVSEVISGAVPPLHVLRTNGKFQGDDGPELAAQTGFALDVLLHARGRDRALVIGFGTGMTPHLVEAAGFARTDVVDLSADILRLGGRHFRRLNGGVLDAPGVSVHVTDGRNFLLLSRDRYDLVGIEISSIWFAGAATLYDREFYRLVRAHLANHGVLQQWVQLHHMTLADVATVLATLRSELPRVWLYESGGQGVLVACADDCAPGVDTRARLEAAPALAPIVLALGGTDRIAATRVLDPAGVDRFLARFARGGLPIEDLVSTDDNLRLEYSTPRGSVLEHTVESNLAALRTPSQP